MNSNRIRILLVDDHQMLRDGLRSLLESEPDLEVSGEANSGKDALQMAEDLQPEVIILDLGLPDINGLEVISMIKDQSPDQKIIVLSMHISREYVSQAVQAGCDGYVPKSSAHSSLLEAIRVVQQGEHYLHPKAASALMDSISQKTSPRDMLKELSDRELEVVRLTALGYTSRESGLQLGISPKTVDTYRLRAMEKLEIEQRSELIRFALKSGLLDDIVELGDKQPNDPL